MMNGKSATSNGGYLYCEESDLIKEIRFVRDFISRWETEPQTSDEQNALIDEWNTWSDNYNPSRLPADEVLAELNNHLQCVIDGKY